MSNPINPETKTKTAAKTQRWGVIALGALAVAMLAAPLTGNAASAALDSGHFGVRSVDTAGFSGYAGMSAPKGAAPEQPTAPYDFGGITFERCDVRSDRLSIVFTGPFVPGGHSEQMQMEVRYLEDGKVVREEPMTESWTVEGPATAGSNIASMDLVKGKSVGAQIRMFDDYNPDTRTTQWLTVELAEGASACTVKVANH